MTSAIPESIQVGALSVRFLVQAGDSNGSVSVFQRFSRPRAGCRRRTAMTPSRIRSDGLEGTTTWTVDGNTLDVPPGEAICIARGAIHGFDNNGAQPAKFLAISTPARDDAGATSMRSTTCSRRPPGVRRTTQRSRMSCAGTA